MGDGWQALATLWLRTEAALVKAGRMDLSFTEIRKSSIPEEWKEWMYAKQMKTDAKRPSESFGKVFTDYLRSLPSSTQAIGGTAMAQIWSRPGKTGIVGLLLCLYWQADCSGAGKDWEDNIKRVEGIFNAILAAPDL